MTEFPSMCHKVPTTNNVLPCRKGKARLLAMSCLLMTQNISLVAGFQSLGQGLSLGVRGINYDKKSRVAALHKKRTSSSSSSSSSSVSDDDAVNDETTLPRTSNSKVEKKEDLPPIEEEATNGSDNSNGAQSHAIQPIQPIPLALQPQPRKRLGLMWCADSYCKDAVRERVRGKYNQIILDGPATGQVAYYWKPDVVQPQPQPQQSSTSKSPISSSPRNKKGSDLPPTSEPSVLLLVKPNDTELIEVAANAVKQLTNDACQIQVSMDSSLAGKLKFQYGVDNDRIRLFEPKATEGYGGSHVDSRDKVMKDFSGITPEESQPPYDLIVTLGGDGLLMHASMLFQGPMPPVISIAGGSLGFLTQFSRDEMVDAVRIALGLSSKELKQDPGPNGVRSDYGDPGVENVFPPNMPSYPYEPLQKQRGLTDSPRFSFGLGDRICLSIRMRLDCTIFNPEGVVRARFNVLNEVVIDRGSSPYLAALECFCDDVHLTTVQADGVIFATPTGSTAYSMAAGGSVVHPAVPCILVTPICPHVLSFRSMVFPDHVVLRAYVPKDARADAAVAFDGRYRRELHRGDSLQIRMSSYPVPTLNRADHSSDWLGSLKRSFNFNTRPRQKPL